MVKFLFCWRHNWQWIIVRFKLNTANIYCSNFLRVILKFGSSVVFWSFSSISIRFFTTLVRCPNSNRTPWVQLNFSNSEQFDSPHPPTTNWNPTDDTGFDRTVVGDLRDAEPRLPEAVPADTVLQVRLAKPHDARRVLPLAVRRPGAPALHALLRDTRRNELSAAPPVADETGRHPDSSGDGHRRRQPTGGGVRVVSLVSPRHRSLSSIRRLMCARALTAVKQRVRRPRGVMVLCWVFFFSRTSRTRNVRHSRLDEIAGYVVGDDFEGWGGRALRTDIFIWRRAGLGVGVVPQGVGLDATSRWIFA